MADKTRTLNLRMIVGLEDKGLKEAIRDTKKFGNTVKGLTDNVIKASAAFVAFRGAQAAMQFGRESVDQANALTRGVAGLGTVFGEATPQMLDFVKSSSEFGMSMAESAKAVTFLGSVLKQSGFAIEDTAELTQRLTRLATDLAITYGYDVQEAMLAMTALFRGEYDPIEKFGVAMKQNEIEGVKLQRGLEKLTGTAEIFADQQIRLELLFMRAADAEGAYARQSETLFVRQQQLAATFKNMQATVGLALTPALEKLAYAMIQIVDAALPVLMKAVEAIIPVIMSATANKEQLAKMVLTLAEAFVFVVKFIAIATKFLIDHIEVIKYVVAAVATVALVGRAYLAYAASVQAARDMMVAFGVATEVVTKRLKVLRFVLVSSGIGAILVGLGLAIGAVMEATSAVEDFGDEFAALDEIDLEALSSELAGATTEVQGFDQSLQEMSGSAGKAADAVGDFYKKMADSAAKQSAKLQLEAMGASEGLINAVLGSGEDWYKVFAHVTRNGLESLREVQSMFMQTAEGFDEAMSKWQEEFDAFQEFKKQAYEAKDALVEFVTEFQILPTISRQLGRFEQAAVDQLNSIEEKLTEAFDNGYLLQESYRNLQTYARQEFAVLRQIERQRDEILARRDAAAALIQSVSDSVRQGARLVNVLQNVQNETERVDVASVVKKTIQDAAGLREFEVIVTSAVVEPIKEVTSQSQKLVAGYRDIVERTRAFVQNMKALRALGLDPQLFNELVEAGVDAGGATAEALIEGGADTVNEVNNLFKELNDLGTELGEETAQVMYGQGENFVDGIVKGLEAQAQSLEDQARALAETFTTTFEDILISGIEAAIAAAEAALARMPRFEGQPNITRTTTTTTTTTGGGIKTDTSPSSLAPNINSPTISSYVPGSAKGGAISSAIRQDAAMAARFKPSTANQTRVAGTTVNINANRIDSRSLASQLSKLYSSGATPTSRTSTYLGR